MPIDIDRIRAHHGAIAGDGTIHVKSLVVKSPAVDFEQRLVSGCVSMAVPDMDNEVVMPDGMDMSYFPKQVKAVYYSHNYEAMPVGTCRSIAVRDGGKAMYAQTYILPGARGDDLLTAMQHGAVNGFSVGFKVDEAGPPTPEEVAQYGTCDTIVRKGTLIEYSITPMPSCPGALMDLATKGLIHRSSYQFFNIPEPPKARVFSVPRVVTVAGRELVMR